MSGSASLPRARSEGLITTETASDLLIYDVDRNELHTLNAEAAAIWRAADGGRSVLDLALELGLDPRVVQEALEKLSNAELLTGYSAGPNMVSSSSRRRMLKSAAVAGAMVVSVSVPLAVSAQSSLACGVVCDPSPQAPDNQCRSSCSQCSTTNASQGAYVCCNPGRDPGCSATAS